ncbi:receptor-type tyrosine-protein phosphatase alpha-like [Crassostrea angulata]|uniref:receptor-type tyrosine-protein phosphatase alpha-like n=1 Tax=Magallana angulata TaxID=2784310 RepID=UPI0022B1466D|nr:receptor-type tyrosine-protein phosphatase alpha-like [Crassostrea angulata]
MNCNHCVFYAVGLLAAFAYDKISLNKIATQSHYPPSGTGYEASKALDGNTETCMRTNTIGDNSPDKTVWWKVDLGGVYSIYSINVQFKNYDGYDIRQRGRFAGFSLYVSDTDVSSIADIKGSTLCYKDGPELPTLNFTTICTKFGRYVLFYNERLKEVEYPDTYPLTNVVTELCEVAVQGCINFGIYGSNCDTPCSSNCKESTCHIQSGKCFNCKPGWTGIYCTTKCIEGWHGTNCSKQCVGHCRDGASCNHETGQCDKGCAAGWTGLQCTEDCKDGNYGYDCINNCSGHCLNNSPCNKQTGHCDGGCDPGYTNVYCNKECTSGHFGLDCRELCSGYCTNNEPCNHVNGICQSGCQDGYMESHCNKSCKTGYFGRNCSRVCSPNCKADTCRHTDGSCTCVAGYTDFNCTTECVLSYGANCQSPCNAYCINQTCDIINGSCTYGCIEGKQCDEAKSHPQTVSSSENISVIGAMLGTCVIVIIGIIVSFFVIRLRRKSTAIAKRQSFLLETKPLRTNNSMVEQPKLPNCRSQALYPNDVVESTYALPEKTKRGPPTNKNISVRNMKAQITNMSLNENNGFKSEYHDIPRGELHPCVEGKKPENKVKNRYTTIFPYDHSRVILKTAASDQGGYINANYIEDTKEKRTYIATQGPKPKTIADFWTMIWQEEVCNIVCLTNLTEGTKNKCAQYWPDINDKLQGGTLTVRHLEEKTYAEYIIRRFKIHNKSTRTDRHVTMFHYTTWSDHGVADSLSLVVFHRQVIRATANSAGKYAVVHCSAGVGRTGTYIALDALYREGERTGKINVPMYVRTMRKDRMNMIQGDDQYRLVYLALRDAFSGRSKCLKTEKFLSYYQEHSCYTNCGDVEQKKLYSSDLEELLSLRKEYTQQDYMSGRAQISANYSESVLPVEEFLCHLSYIKDHNTYYNAVLLQSFLEKDSLISAQYPLPDNTEDFLRLIKDFDARVVVFLCPLKDIESTSKWYPSEGQTKFDGMFDIKNLSSTKASNVTINRLNIQPTGFNQMDITVLECPKWREKQKTSDKRILLDVIKAVKTEKTNEKGRVLVLSSDGATRCGPFFVVYNVLEQISVDREVDIFTAVRQIQIRRPECVSTVEEYQLCHDAVAEYLLNDCVYGNC